MDYIRKKINERMNIVESGSHEYITLLQERIEYILFLTFGYLYNKNRNKIDFDVLSDIVCNLKNMTIGEVANAICRLDTMNDELGKQKKIIDKYPRLRNTKLGHGYIHSDMISDVEDEFTKLYDDLCKNIWIQQDIEFIKVIDTKKTENNYSGYRIDINGGLAKWSCKCTAECINNIEILDNAVLIFINNQYYKVSPFIEIDDGGESIYVFSSLENKISGKVKFNQLLKTSNMYKNYTEFTNIYEEFTNKKVSTNGTIMNIFTSNYNKYIPTSIEDDILDFVIDNKSNVLGTVWGHGGVGKTAAIQHVCESLFADEKKHFDYIVFLSAKDRMFDPLDRKIKPIINLRTYEELIIQIVLILFDETIENNNKIIIEYEDKISLLEEKILLVVDDYETFSENDMQKINEFINRLNFYNHRVIITTRSLKLTNGFPIRTNEFNKEKTYKFLSSVIENEYPEHVNAFKNNARIMNSMEKIQIATEGRALSIIHFAHLLVQKGISDNVLDELRTCEDVSSFLYDRIFCLLSPVSRNVFICISQITSEQDLIFKKSLLEYILIDKHSEEDIESSIHELCELRVIESCNIDYIRVYTNKLLKEMKSKYNECSEPFKKLIKEKISDVGGKEIKKSIYHALLDEASKSKSFDTMEVVSIKYMKIIRDSKCPNEVKKSAIFDYLKYLGLNSHSSDELIKLDAYFDAYKDDSELISAYVRILWNVDEEGKKRACKKLENISAEWNGNQVNSYDNELFAIKTWFLTTYILKKYRETKNKTDKELLHSYFQKYGNVLYKNISNLDLHSILDKNKIDCIEEALLVSIEAYMEISKDSEKSLQYIKYFIEYANKSFTGSRWSRAHMLLKELKQLFSRLTPSILKVYNYEDFFEAKVCKVYRTMALLEVDRHYKVAARLNDISRQDISDMKTVIKENQYFDVKIKEINEFNEVFVMVEL